MSTAARSLLAVALGCCVHALGCSAATALGTDIADVQSRLERVVREGGYYCAPRELALARAHLVFASVDREQGELEHAYTQLRQADLNARAAERLSPSERCAASTRGAPTQISPAQTSSGPDPDHDGIGASADRCPTEPEDADGYADGDGCPEPDNDLDGRLDALDHCPLEPEDVDGQMDGDGCPDRDADGDGVDDGIDKCPVEPGPAVDSGCPRLRYRGVELTPTAARLLEPVLFEEGGATIRSVSFGVLDSLVELLREHPDVTLEVQGHTDSPGEAAANVALSQARAEAVVRYLVDRGAEASRLTPKGYGETRPMESNRTSQGRALNRRIELVRTDGGP